MDKTELQRLEDAVKLARRRFEASARGVAYHASSANCAGHVVAMEGLQDAQRELIHFKRVAHEAASRSDAWLRACERTS